MSVSGGKLYTCVKSGKKLVWNKGEKIAKPTSSDADSPVVENSPAPTPKPLPTAVNVTFDNLIENNDNISYTAWKKTAAVITSSSSKVGSLTTVTGPKTRPYFDDVPYAISLVSKMFPNKAEPKEILWIRYVYADIKWAESTAKEKLSAGDYEQISRNQGGTIAGSNCDAGAANCRGSYQQTGPSGIALIMQGVENPPSSDGVRMSTGMLEAHEYFHSLQRIPIMGTGVQVWPHAWWREGGAEWVQNAAVNYNNYEKYKSFLTSDCAWSCAKLSEEEISEFLSTAKDNFVPAKFDQFLNYSLGSHVIEILVAMRGPDALVDMYAEVGKGKTFDDAFNGIYGISWSTAIPLISKSIYKTLHS